MSYALSISACVLAFWWGSVAKENENGFLGGFNTCTLHAVLMIFAFCFSQTQAVLAYRINHSVLSHLTCKILHGLWHGVVVGVTVAALVYIVDFHNEKKFDHLSSFHSWLGVVLLILYSNNYVLGFLSFTLPQAGSPSRLRWAATYLPSHRFVGMTTFFFSAVVMTTVCGYGACVCACSRATHRCVVLDIRIRVPLCSFPQGIMQKAWLDGGGCIPAINSLAVQNNPALGYATIPPGCRVGDAVGLLIIANAIVGVYALWDFSYVGSNHFRPPMVEAEGAGDGVKARPTTAPLEGDGDGDGEVGPAARKVVL